MPPKWEESTGLDVAVLWGRQLTRPWAKLNRNASVAAEAAGSCSGTNIGDRSTTQEVLGR